MTTDVRIDADRRAAEFTLEKGCVACGGDLSVRLTPVGARSVCIQCHWLSKPQVALDNGRLSFSPMMGVSS